MKVAYCIICHKNSKILRENIKILSEDNDIYIHVDKKSNIEDFDDIKGENIIIIKNRVEISWGNYSQIQATLNLLQETKKKYYDYIFLLSGDCLPLKNNKDIKVFLENNNNKEFVAKDIVTDETYRRIKYNYSKHYFKKDKTISDKMFIKIYNLFKEVNKNKYFDKLPQLYKGTNWFGITANLRDYILEYLRSYPWYMEAFKNSVCGDEVFFHTIIFNSPFAKNVYDPKDKSNICYQALRYIDWKTGPDFPRTLSEVDFEKMKSTECLFARKFNENLDLNLYRKTFIDNN